MIEDGMFIPSPARPGSPGVKQPGLALEIARRNDFAWIIELWKRKIRRRLADQGRRQFMRVDRQPYGKKTDHDDEDPEWDEKPAHDTVWRAICVAAGTAASFRRHASR